MVIVFHVATSKLLMSSASWRFVSVCETGTPNASLGGGGGFWLPTLLNHWPKRTRQRHQSSIGCVYATL